jgi:predicted transposase/invertase (TIGR01784 family)
MNFRNLSSTSNCIFCGQHLYFYKKIFYNERSKRMADIKIKTPKTTVSSGTKVLKPLKDLNLMDRFLFAQVMEDPEILGDMIQIILGHPVELDGNPQAEKEQRTVTWSKSVRLDVWAVDKDGTYYDTEVQNRDTHNLPRRSRYYQGVMDSRMLPVGEVDYNRLNAVYIIMIMPFDLFGRGRYQYVFTMRDREDPTLELNDGAVRIFLNTHGTNPEDVRPDLVELLNYMEHTNAQTANSCTNGQIRKMQERIEQIKVSEEVGVKYMQAWEERVLDMNEARQEGREQGIEIGTERGIEIGTARGREEGREEMILNALKKGKECKDIAEFNDLDLPFVLEVAKRNGFDT